MLYELEDTSKVKNLFEGWTETLIYSCLQKVMGKVFVTDLHSPKSAMAFVGCFGFYAGKPDRELVLEKPDGFVIMTPQNEKWAELIEECFPKAKRVVRYAIKKDTHFDITALQQNAGLLPKEYELKPIDAILYDQCLEDPTTIDFVSSFGSKEEYMNIGRGMVIIKNGKIVSGASSYTRYKEGIEIEVDTVPTERRKHLATIACSALILRCLEENLYPSWDAQNMDSVHLAESLGYEFDHEYIAYEIMDKELSEMTLAELWELFPIFLVEYNEKWNIYYKELEAFLQKILKGISVDRISHIGSTAIKGIWAKDIVDVLIEISNDDDIEGAAQVLEQNSFLRMFSEEKRISLNRGYTKTGFADKVFHVHLRYSGDNDELFFRDYLNEHPQIAKEYETLKLALWKKYEHNRDAYTEGKTDFISKWTAEARKIYGDRYSVIKKKQKYL